MVSTYTTDIDNLVAKLEHTLHQELVIRIKNHINAKIQQVVNEAAESLARDLKGSIQHRRDLREDKIEVTLILNGEVKEIK